jgi:hypothetical protein
MKEVLMDERRYRTVLETVDALVKVYGEPTLVAALGTVLEPLGYEVAKKDPGPCCCEFSDFYEQQGIMAPIHDCPAVAPTEEDEFNDADLRLIHDAFDIPRARLGVIDMRRRLS